MYNQNIKSAKHSAWIHELSWKYKTNNIQLLCPNIRIHRNVNKEVWCAFGEELTWLADLEVISDVNAGTVCRQLEVWRGDGLVVMPLYAIEQHRQRLQRPGVEYCSCVSVSHHCTTSTFWMKTSLLIVLLEIKPHIHQTSQKHNISRWVQTSHC